MNPTHLFSAREILERLCKKFPRTIDVGVFKELDRISAILETDFLNHRLSDHLAKLAYSIFLIRKKLTRNIALFPLKDWNDIRLLPFSLHYTFGSKQVLGVLAHAYVKDKYEAFDEDHLLFIIRKSNSEAQLIRGSIYAFQPSKNSVKTLYFEIDKKSGLPFSHEEILHLKKSLKQEMQFCIERLIPQVFMIRNEEEIFKNILTLSKEITDVTDFPQVMILFEQQTSQDATFTIILITVGQKDLSQYVLDRSVVVKYLQNSFPIVASVFKMNVPKDPSLLRADSSLNFYLARQKVCQALQDTVGEFRDYNGGIILKQRETMAAFMEAFPDLSDHNRSLLESFFYSIAPLEAQATLPLASLKAFFRLFLEAFHFNLQKTSDYFFKFEIDHEQLFFMIRSSDRNLPDRLQQILASFQLMQTQIIFSNFHLHNTDFLGYLILTTPPHLQAQISLALTEGLKEWKRKLENQQILKLGLQPSAISLDPRIGGDQISSLVLKMLFEGLMRENQEGKIDYGIAKNVEISSDQKTYIFKLRSAYWSDGSLVSAYDFEYAWKKILSPHFKTPFAYLFYPIKNAKLAKEGAVPAQAIGIQALDEITLKIELESPTPYFLELTAHTLYSPVHRLKDQIHPNWPFEEKETFICNGAFQLNKNHQEGHELIKNPLYWDVENIKLDQAIFTKAESYQSYQLYQYDQNHWIGAPLGTWNTSISPGENDATVHFLNNTIYWYVFNTQKFPLNHKKVRQALALSINRSQLQALLNINPAMTPLPSLHSQLSESRLDDLHRAKALFQEALAEMKIPLADFPPLPLIHLAGSIRNQVAELVKEQWQTHLGIQTHIEPVEWKTLFSKMTEGDFVVGGMNWQPWISDPIYTLNAFKHSKDPINFAKWEHSEYQKILDRAQKEICLEARKSCYLQAEEMLLEEMPVIPVFHVTSQAFKKKNLQVPYTTSLVNFKWAYFSNDSA